MSHCNTGETDCNTSVWIFKQLKIKNMKERGVIHNNAVSNNFVSDINQILKIGMEITAKIIDINEKGVVLSMKNLN